MPDRERYGVVRSFLRDGLAMRNFLHAVLAAFVLVGAVQRTASADEIPAGKLAADVAPRHYALKFKVDPREDRFSGETHILVKLAKPADRVFLHAQNIDIAKATVTANAEKRDAKAIAHA